MRQIAYLIFLLSIHFSATAQTTWYVPDDFATIQGAIADPSVQHGNTIIVRPGIYVENIDFLTKGITLKSEQGPDVTVIDGNQTGSVVKMGYSGGGMSILDGFTLTNGSGTKFDDSTGFFDYKGGGIFCIGGSPIIMNNRIMWNCTEDHGGGIACIYSSPNITSNTISSNSTGDGGGIHSYDSNPVIRNNAISGNTAYFGGGIWWSRSDPKIIKNTISGNSASQGGGIYSRWYSSPTITNNIITGNSASDGGGIRSSGSTMNITGNIISWNSAQNNGGGFYCWDTDAVAINNTITGNSAAYGGGIANNFNSHLAITNTILWDNLAPEGPEIWTGSGHILTISYSDVRGGQSSVHIGPYGIIDWGAGMIESDPMFVSFVDSDFHLTYLSPCKDGGDNSAVTVFNDFEYHPRIAYGTVDMGADEFYPHFYYTGDATPSGTIQAKFVNLPGTLINGVILGVNIFDPPLPCDYGLWYIDNPMQIITGLGAIPSDGIALFPGTIPAIPPAPYTIYLQGVIDMALTNLCPVQIG